jgi:hypothetical protein
MITQTQKHSLRRRDFLADQPGDHRKPASGAAHLEESMDKTVTDRELLKSMILDINNICRTPQTSTDKIRDILRLCDSYEDRLKK